MSRSTVTVGNEDVSKPGPRHGIAVVHEQIAHHALAHGHRAHRLEGEGAEVQRGRQDDVPALALRHDALGDGLREVATREGVHAHGQVRAMSLERARGEDDNRAIAGQRIEGGARELLEEMNAQKLDPFVAAR